MIYAQEIILKSNIPTQRHGDVDTGSWLSEANASMPAKQMFYPFELSHFKSPIFNLAFLLLLMYCQNNFGLLLHSYNTLR